MPTFSYSARPATGGEMKTGELDLPTNAAWVAVAVAAAIGSVGIGAVTRILSRD